MWLQVVLILISMYNVICCNVEEKTAESKEEMRQLVWLQVVLILMSMYNLICCNVEEETVEAVEVVEPNSAATGTYI